MSVSSLRFRIEVRDTIGIPSVGYGTILEGPHDKDCSLLGSMLGLPELWKLHSLQLNSKDLLCTHNLDP